MQPRARLMLLHDEEIAARAALLFPRRLDAWAKSRFFIVRREGVAPGHLKRSFGASRVFSAMSLPC